MNETFITPEGICIVQRTCNMLSSNKTHKHTHTSAAERYNHAPWLQIKILLWKSSTLVSDITSHFMIVRSMSMRVHKHLNVYREHLWLLRNQPLACTVQMQKKKKTLTFIAQEKRIAKPLKSQHMKTKQNKSLKSTPNQLHCHQWWVLHFTHKKINNPLGRHCRQAVSNVCS